MRRRYGWSIRAAEQERKSERMKLANEAAALNGKRSLSAPRPFGYQADHVTPDPAEGPAVAGACAVLLGGGTLSGVMREWTKAGVHPVQSKSGRGWMRQSIRTILLNPRIAGLSTYRGEIVGHGQWEPLVSEETWRAVHAILKDPARKPPKGVRTLLGGLAMCPCGNVVSGQPSHTGQRVYRCLPPTRNPGFENLSAIAGTVDSARLQAAILEIPAGYLGPAAAGPGAPPRSAGGHADHRGCAGHHRH
jgi:site-specific DNA recombinase